MHEQQILVVGGTGKTGRRVAERLTARGVAVRIGSRQAAPAFVWEDPATWDACLDGVTAAYVAYAPDLAVPGAPATVEAFAARAKVHGLERLVLLSGRGEAEAEDAERRVQAVLPGATVLRCSWFMQGLSESELAEGVRAGALVLPVDGVAEPFVDAEDIADCAVAALLEDGHAGALYELTGPQALRFDEAVALIARASGREITYTAVPLDAWVEGARAGGVPEPYLQLLAYLFGEVLDGRNAAPADGVQRCLGRPPRDFAAYAERTFAEVPVG